MELNPQQQRLKYIDEMAEALGCGHDDKVKTQLAQAFLSINDTHLPVSLRPKMALAMQQLSGNYLQKYQSNNPDFLAFLKTLTTFRDGLKQADDLVSDKYVKDYLVRTTFGGHKVEEFTDDFMRASYLNTFLGIRRLLKQMDTFLNSGKRTQGRPSLKVFYDYVYAVAVLYMELSGKSFSIMRHQEKTRDGQVRYPPITPAHQFVTLAVRIMETEARHARVSLECTDKNIYNACENAQKRLKSAPR